METTPRITVRTAHDDMQAKFKMVLTKPSAGHFKVELNDVCYTYPIDTLFQVFNILANEHLRHKHEWTFLLIESNLTYTKDTRGKYVGKDAQPFLELFNKVLSIKAPMNMDYVTQLS